MKVEGCVPIPRPLNYKAPPTHDSSCYQVNVFVNEYVDWNKERVTLDCM